MATTLGDVLNANLVLVGVELLNEPDAVERFRNELAPDLRLEVGMFVDGATGLPEPSRTLTLGKDRIQLTLHSSRATIAREYPDESGLPRLAQVATRAIELTKLESRLPQAFGYNIELVFDQNSGQPALQYIGNRLFASLPINEPGRYFIGGTGQLIYADADGRRTITVQPRFNYTTTSRVFLSLNLHKQEQRFPDEAEIQTTLKEIQQEAVAFADRLEQVRAS